MHNGYVAEAVYDIFAVDARSTMTTDGACDEFVGVDAIHAARTARGPRY